MSKILVIEDDLSLQNYIINLLKIGGYDPVAASSGKTGLKIALEEIPDLILCDIILPGMDGYKILNELQSDNLFANIPFIFITGKSERTDYRKAMELGADDFLVKPFTNQELLNAVASRLKKRRKKLQTSIAEAYKPERLNKIKSTISGRMQKKLDHNDRILLNAENNSKLVKINSIKCISAVGDYSHVITEDSNKFFVRKPMKEWESILPENSFVRIHRSTIINMNFIQNIEKWFNNIYKVFIKGVNKPFIISRRYGSKLKSKFSFNKNNRLSLK